MPSEGSGLPAHDHVHGATASAWPDVILLAVVLTALIALLARGIPLEQALGVLGAAGLLVPDLRRRLSS
ncbi:hypothetical protein ADK76_37940 [Streptomyces griseoflavus]|nr:hypothetical protein ADK76_37940 [Streptomyces griseoflavus]